MSAKINKFLKYWLPVLLWAGLIFYLSAVPNLNSGLVAFWDVFLRKLAHAAEFGILNVLIFCALRGNSLEFKKALILSFFIAVAFAFLDEAHQYFVAERQAKLADVGIDSLGIIFIIGLLFLIGKSPEQKKAHT